METRELGQIALRRELVEKVGLSRPHASEMAKGNRKPSLKMAANIEQLLSIPASSWTTGDPCEIMWKLMSQRESAQ